MRIFALLLLVCAGPALAQQGYCSGPLSFGEDNAIRLMRVESSAPRVNFIENNTKDKPRCPDESPACKRKGFVVPGDVVLAGARPAAIPCVSYIAPGVRRVKGQFAETNGYLPASALKDVPTGTPRQEDWLGTWSRSSEADIEIVAGQNGKLRIKGEATFGALDAGRVQRGAINMGDLEGEAMPKGNMIALGEGYDGTKPFGDDRSECRARLRLFDRYLVVDDNGGCGGMNVSFTGIYVRLRPVQER